VPAVALPGISGIFQEIETKLDQAALAEAATKSRVLIIDPGIDDSHANPGPQVALATQLVYSGHDMRVVIAFMSSGVTAAKAVSITLNMRVVGHTRDSSLNLVDFANGRDLLDGRPRGDLLHNSGLILFIIECE